MSRWARRLPRGGRRVGQRQARLGRDVNPAVYPPAEFRKKIRAGHHFLTTVLQEPRLFAAVGARDVLAGLGAERVAPRPQVRPVK